MKSDIEVQELIKSCGNNYVRLLQKLGVLYIRPKRVLEPIGPLVGRQSTYSNPDIKREPLHYVSENYYNGKVLLLYPTVIKHLAQAILEKMQPQSAIRQMTFRGLAPGGEMLAHFLELEMKKLPGLQGLIGSENGQDKVVLVQDILDPMQLKKAIEVTQKIKKEIFFVCAIIEPDRCFDGFVHASQGPIVLITLIKELLVRYQQDHPLVKEDVDNGNIVWDPKNDWDLLAKVIEEADIEPEKVQQRLVV